jgi:branched-chain amino acid transport system substrate-binding protein
MLLKKNRIVVFFVPVVFFLLAFSFCALAGEGPIKVGLTSAWDFAGGQGVKRGTLMAVRDINAAGGILGRKIEPVAYDNKGTSDEAKKVTERLLYRDKVDAIIGFWRSELAIASQPLVMEAKKILFLTGACAPILTEGRITEDYDTYKYTFCTLISGGRFKYLFTKPIDIARDEIGLKKMALIAESTAFLQPLVKYVSENYKDMIVYKTKFSASTTDFSMEFSKAKAAGADLLYVLSSGPAGTASVKQWYDMEVPALYTGYNVEAQDANFWKNTEAKCDGVQTVQVGGATGIAITAKSIPWYKSYKDLYGEYPISLMDPLAYDAVWAWATAVEKAGTTDSEAVLKALESKDYKYTGVSGIIEGFDKVHNPYGGAWEPGGCWGLTPLQWQNGKRQVIYPTAYKSADMMIPARIKKLTDK